MDNSLLPCPHTKGREKSHWSLYLPELTDTGHLVIYLFEWRFLLDQAKALAPREGLGPQWLLAAALGARGELRVRPAVLFVLHVAP